MVHQDSEREKEYFRKLLDIQRYYEDDNYIIKKYEDLAFDAEEDNNWEQAIRYYTVLIEMFPYNDYYIYRADCFQKLSKFEKAYNDYYTFLINKYKERKHNVNEYAIPEYFGEPVKFIPENEQ